MEQGTSKKIALHKDEDENVIDMHCSMQASILRTMYDVENRFHDVTLFGIPPSSRPAIPLHPIRAHKNILASASKHLLDLFVSDSYTDSHQSEYHIENVDHESLKRIVEFIYTGSLSSMTAENAVDVTCGVLIGADYLIIKRLSDACEAFLTGRDQLKRENCFKLWRFARKYGRFTLLHATTTFMAKNLAVRPADAEFLELSFEECAKLLLSEAFVTASADRRCLAAIAWLNHSAERESYVYDILNMIPLLAFGSVPVSTIHEAYKSEMLQKHAPETIRKLTNHLLELVDPPQPVGGNFASSNNFVANSWYVIGAEYNSQSFLHYDTNLRVWSILPKLPWPRTTFGTCAVGSRIIIMGGEKNGEDETNIIDEYDLVSKTWSTSPVELHDARADCGACTDGQQVYILGGFTRCRGSVLSYLPRSEMYNWKAREISKIPSIDTGRAQFGLAGRFDSNNNYCIYAAGGDDNVGERIGKVDISINKWEMVGNMTTGNRYGLAATFSGDDLYLIGGKTNSGKVLDVVEVFDTCTGQIRSLEQNLLQAREGCCATTLYNGNVICVLGGQLSDEKQLANVETYDKREGKWSVGKIVPNIPVKTAYFGFAAV